MPNFRCENCGDTLLKRQVDKHCQTKCKQAWYFTCCDCNKTFEGFEYEKHLSCITEEEAYYGQYAKKRSQPTEPTVETSSKKAKIEEDENMESKKKTEESKKNKEVKKDKKKKDAKSDSESVFDYDQHTKKEISWKATIEEVCSLYNNKPSFSVLLTESIALYKKNSGSLDDDKTLTYLFIQNLSDDIIKVKCR